MSEAERLAREWLARAVEDIAAAEAVLADETLAARIAAWQAQQAAEKAIKALLVREQIEFPFTHDLAALHQRLPAPLSAETAERLEGLSRYAVEARYPGPWPDPERADAQEAVATARAVVADVAARFAGPTDH